MFLLPFNRNIRRFLKATWSRRSMASSTMFGNHWRENNVSENYHKFRPEISPACLGKIIDFCLTRPAANDPMSLVIDVGCGTGLSTKVFTPHFARVLGVDPSSAQISKARDAYRHLANVRFEVGRAESLPGSVAAESADLVACCQSAHWMDVPRALAEFDRVLKPSGVVALTCYNNPVVLGSEEATDVWREFNQVLWTSGSWHARRHWVEDSYSEITIPYAEKVELRFDEVTAVSRLLSVDDFFAYLSTVSGYITFARNNANAADVLAKYRRNMLEVLGACDGSFMIDVMSKNTLLMGRKPSIDK